MPITSDVAQVGDAFSTPSVVHFCVVLLLSALVSIPWDVVTYHVFVKRRSSNAVERDREREHEPGE
ncbi:MAG: hypothetical protein U0175_17570 [Caldilineaceae bacterium]